MLHSAGFLFFSLFLKVSPFRMASSSTGRSGLNLKGSAALGCAWLLRETACLWHADQNPLAFSELTLSSWDAHSPRTMRTAAVLTAGGLRDTLLGCHSWAQSAKTWRLLVVLPRGLGDVGTHLLRSVYIFSRDFARSIGEAVFRMLGRIWSVSAARRPQRCIRHSRSTLVPSSW